MEGDPEPQRNETLLHLERLDLYHYVQGKAGGSTVGQDRVVKGGRGALREGDVGLAHEPTKWNRP